MRSRKKQQSLCQRELCKISCCSGGRCPNRLYLKVLDFICSMSIVPGKSLEKKQQQMLQCTRMSIGPIDVNGKVNTMVRDSNVMVSQGLYSTATITGQISIGTELNMSMPVSPPYMPPVRFQLSKASIVLFVFFNALQWALNKGQFTCVTCTHTYSLPVKTGS